MPINDHDTIRDAATSTDQLLTAEQLGVSPWAMSRMVEAGVLQRMVPGVYVSARCARHALLEAAAWSLRYPYAVAGLLTAAGFHGLTDAFSGGTWLLVPKGSSVPRSRNSPLRVVQVTPRWIAPELDLENGIQTVTVHGMSLRLTNPDRTVLDLWRSPRRVSVEHALQALRWRSAAKDFDIPRFARLARSLGIWGRLEPVIQGMSLR